MNRLILAAAAVAALSSCGQSAYATYNGPKFDISPEVGAWVSELTSDGGGRCCEFSDAVPDANWRASKTAESGYAVEYMGKWYDVANDVTGSSIYQHHFAGDGEFVDIPVTDNKVGVPLLWMRVTYDPQGVPLAVVRCFLPGGAG